MKYNKLIILFSFFLVIGCAPGNTKSLPPRTDTSYKAQVRREHIIREILNDIKDYEGDQEIIIDSLFVDRDSRDALYVRKELRSRIEPELATEPLKGSAGEIREILQYILLKYWLSDALKIREWLDLDL